MLVHPEAQKKAHAELDRVVGSGRLPDFSDRETLPYIDCIVQETLRYVCDTNQISIRTSDFSDAHVVPFPNGRRYLVAPLGEMHLPISMKGI